MKNKIIFYITLSLAYTFSQYCLFIKFKDIDNTEKKCGTVKYCESSNSIYASNRLYVLYDGVETLESIKPGTCRFYSIGDQVCFNKRTYNVFEWVIFGLMSLIGFLLDGVIIIFSLQFLIKKLIY
jgi:hypothetical protein